MKKLLLFLILLILADCRTIPKERPSATGDEGTDRLIASFAASRELKGKLKE